MKRNKSAEAAEAVPIPAALDVPEFRELWAEWLAERRSRGKPVTARAASLQFKKLIPLGPAAAAECLSLSIASGWASVWPDSVNRTGAKARGGGFIPPEEREAELMGGYVLDTYGGIDG